MSLALRPPAHSAVTMAMTVEAVPVIIGAMCPMPAVMPIPVAPMPVAPVRPRVVIVARTVIDWPGIRVVVRVVVVAWTPGVERRSADDPGRKPRDQRSAVVPAAPADL